MTASSLHRKTRDCSVCGRKYSCLWVDDAWVCRARSCGAEFYPEPGGNFTVPEVQPDTSVCADCEGSGCRWLPNDEDEVGEAIWSKSDCSSCGGTGSVRHG